MLKVMEMQDNGKFIVIAQGETDTSWLIREFDAVTRRAHPERYEIRGSQYAAVQARVSALRAAKAQASNATPARATGTCVLCGDPTDRPYYRYCSECYGGDR